MFLDGCYFVPLASKRCRLVNERPIFKIFDNSQQMTERVVVKFQRLYPLMHSVPKNCKIQSVKIFAEYPVNKSWTYFILAIK